MTDETEIEFVLKRAAVTKGQILDPSGKPVPWAMVTIERDGKRVETLYADGDGRFVSKVATGAVIDIIFTGICRRTSATPMPSRCATPSRRRCGTTRSAGRLTPGSPIGTPR